MFPAPRETANRIEEAAMRNQNQTIDQKKGSADRSVTGSKQGMPGGDIGRNSMAGKNAASSKSDYGGSEGNSRERKSSRSGSDSSES
jgi:hypothetical protein